MASECGWIDGSCALVCLIIDNILYVVNLGDSDAALYGKNISTLLTQHHHPTLKEEIEFIEKAGGVVETYWGQQRVTCKDAKHALAVTRAFGDLEFKRPKRILNSCPTITTHELTGKENYLVMASDGLWDAKSVTSVGKFFQDLNKIDNLGKIADTLISSAVEIGSDDDITVIIVDLPKFIKQ